MRQRQIFAFSGMLVSASDSRGNSDLTAHALTLTGRSSSIRACYLPTAVGDSPVAVDAKRREFAAKHPEVELSILTLFTQPSAPDIRAHLLAQDLIFVEGGSVANLMAVWRVHSLPEILRDCWEAGVVLAGASAGSLCWHAGGPTDSFGDGLSVFTDGLALVPFSNGVHDDFTDQPRRQTYRDMVASGAIPPGYASEDGVGLHYVDTHLHEAISIREGATAWWVEGTREEQVATRLL